MVSLFPCMKVRILKVEPDELVDARIKEGEKFRLPSIHDGWRFNFHKHAKATGARTYVLVSEETPGNIEGCLVYKMREEQEPYMAYIEIAPWNKGENKKYDLVAGCLIAFACRQSFILASGDFKGWLAFDVMEASEEDQNKLMALYSRKYKALRMANTTTMIIRPEDGEKLIEKYLNR